MAPTSLVTVQDAQGCVHVSHSYVGAIVGASVGSFVAGLLLSLLVYAGGKLYRSHKVKKDMSAWQSKTRKISEEGWSWRERKANDSAFPSYPDLCAQESRSSSAVGAYRPRGSPASSPSHSTPSLPLPALLKDSGMVTQQEKKSLRINTSNPPSYVYEPSVREPDSPGSLYSQASATTFMHRRISMPPEDVPPVPTIPHLSRRHDSVNVSGQSPQAPKAHEESRRDQQVQTELRPILKRPSTQSR